MEALCGRVTPLGQWSCRGPDSPAEDLQESVTVQVAAGKGILFPTNDLIPIRRRCKEQLCVFPLLITESQKIGIASVWNVTLDKLW